MKKPVLITIYILLPLVALVLVMGLYFTLISKKIEPKIVSKITQTSTGTESIDKILSDSGVYANNIYNPDKDVIEVEKARDRQFEIPTDYELAIELKYTNATTTTPYIIKVLRQIESTSTEEFTDLSDRMPEKALIVAIVKDNNIINNLFVISGYSVLEGSEGYRDYDKTKIAEAVELKDLDNNGLNEILVRTFKGYTADTENGLITIYFDAKKNLFATTDKVFMSTWKEAYQIIELNKKYYVVEAVSGNGSCRICPTPYMVNIYQSTGDYYFPIGSVAVEKEYDTGFEAIEDAMPRVKKKILAGDVFTF